MRRIILSLIMVILTGVALGAERLTAPLLPTATIVALRDSETEPIPLKIATLRGRAGTPTEAIVDNVEIPYQVGDAVVWEREGNGVARVVEFDRLPGTVRLVAVFLIAVLAISGIQALRSLLGLFISIGVVFSFILPQIAAGAHPIVVALIASLIILVASYYLTHGVNAKTTIAIIGSLGALGVVGALALVFARLMHITGYGAEEVFFLPAALASPQTIRNVLLAGMLIGSLGVLDDITIAQASIVAELKAANHKLDWQDLYQRAMRVGHDHIASLVNTLVLVYTGSALPLLLLFTDSNQRVAALVNYEAVAEEILTTLVGSIGLVAAVPVTTLIASWYFAQTKRG